MRTPEVLTGPRSRDERPKVSEHGPGAEMDVVPTGKVVFQAVAGRYRLQLTAPEEQKRSDGTIRRERALVAQFDDYRLVLDLDKKEINSEGKPWYREREIAERIMAHEQYGTDFWNAEEIIAAAQEKKRAEVVSILQNPDDRAAIIEALKAGGYEDFDLPKPKKEKA